MRRRGEIVIALHAGAFAGYRGHRDALAGAQIGAVEAGRGHQHHAADAARGRRAARFGHALDRKARGFGFAGAAFEFGRRGNFAVEQIEIGELARQQRRIGETDIFVVGRDARHRDRALGELCDAIAAKHRWSRPRPGAARPARAIRHRRLRSARIPRRGRRALRRLARRRAPQPRRRRPRPRAWRPRPAAAPASRAPIDRTGRRSRKSSKAAKRWMVKSSQTKSLTLKRAGTQIGKTHQMCLIHRDFKHFARAKCQTFSAFAARSRQSCEPRSCQSCRQMQGG